MYDTNLGKLVFVLVQIFKRVKWCFPERRNRFKVRNIFISKVAIRFCCFVNLKVASTDLIGVTVVSLSKTHLPLLSTGSTQEDPSQHN